MSGAGQTIKNSADPLNILGGSGSSVGGNVIDPANIFHMDNSGFQNNGNVFNGSGVAPAQLPPGYGGIPTLPSNLGVPTLQGYMLGVGGGQGTIPGYPLNPGSPGSGAGSPMPFMGGQGGLLNSQMPNGPTGTPNYNPGGGYMPAPIGGYWNQIAQQMAGPMFGPQGSSVTLGAQNPVMPQQQSNMTVPQQMPTTPATSQPATPPPSTPVSYTPNPMSGTYALQRHLSMLGGGLNGNLLGRTFMK